MTGLACSKREPAGAARGAGIEDAAAPATARDAAEIPHRIFPSAAAALAEVLQSRPRVIGLGELHQTTATTHVPAALEHFTGGMLDVLGPVASDIIVETWVQDGACGAQEQEVGADIQQATRRPPETENQVLALLERARGLGIQPHVLRLRCADYDMLQGEDGAVDYEALLVLVTRELRATTARVLAHREAHRDREGRDAGAVGSRSRELVVVYGGSLHNDLHPYEALAEYSYAAEIARQSGDRYVELDLYVPEIAEGNKLLAGEPWYPLIERLTAPDRVVLIERSPASFLLLLPRS